MSDPKLFVLVSISEDALMGHWSFRAADEAAIAQRLLQDPWDYPDIFWALRISTKQVQKMRPEELLQAIHDSYFNPHTPATLYLFPMAQPVDCAPAEPPPSPARA